MSGQKSGVTTADARLIRRANRRPSHTTTTTRAVVQTSRIGSGASPGIRGLGGTYSYGMRVRTITGITRGAAFF